MTAKLPAILLLLLFGVAHAQGQYAPAYCPPGVPTYPFPGSRTTPLQTLLFVKIGGPAGMKITFYRGANQAVTLDAPCVVGLRPGYFYRCTLWGMKRFPGLTFHPTLEVRGSLLLGGNLRACDFPAGLVFKESDFAQVLDGSLVRKVIFVEKVENALPESSSPDNPFEIVVPPARDPLEEARDHGLPLMIVDLGERQVPFEDMLRGAIPGTILLPGDAFLPRPPVVPCLPWSCVPIYDPLLGPAPWLYYSLPDGGDWGEPARYDSFGRFRGLDPSDTLARYTDSLGRPKIAASNRVCLCIPRFLVVRNEARLSAVTTPASPELTEARQNHLFMETKIGLKMHDQRRHLELVRDKLKASGVEKLQVTAVTGRVQNLDVTVTISGPANVTGTRPPEKAAPPEGKDVPLKVDKWPDKCGGVVGDIITFYIRYTNLGGQPITNVIVSDNLISRFEYVKGSAKTSRPATFTVQPNDVGSSIVQWDIDGVLRPGEQGTVSFEVRIR